MEKKKQLRKKDRQTERKTATAEEKQTGKEKIKTKEEKQMGRKTATEEESN